jgi:hypothetical protein
VWQSSSGDQLEAHCVELGDLVVLGLDFGGHHMDLVLVAPTRTSPSLVAARQKVMVRPMPSVARWHDAQFPHLVVAAALLVLEHPCRVRSIWVKSTTSY